MPNPVIDILKTRESEARSRAVEAEQNAVVHRAEQKAYREAWQSLELKDALKEQKPG